MMKTISEAVEKGNILNYQQTANDLIQKYGNVDALAAVLELMAGDNNREKEVLKVKLTAERPIKVKRLPGSNRSSFNRNHSRDNRFSKNDYYRGHKDNYKKDSFKSEKNNKSYSKPYNREGKKSYKNNSGKKSSFAE